MIMVQNVFHQVRKYKLAKCLEATEALGVVALGPLGWAAASMVHLLQLFKSQNHQA